VHVTHNVDILDNATFEVFGHYYFEEDGIETGNTFPHVDLGFNTRKF